MKTNPCNGPVRDASLVTLSLLAWNFGALPAAANPTGGTVAQGSATFNAAGSQLTIHTATAGTVINWQTFNVGAGETTTFVEPTSSSVVWNHITDANPSSILGSINANGYVVLQNQNGFVVGGNAAIKAAGLVMTTSPTPPPTLANGGAWQFDAPPPAAKIINYGQITVAGGPAYLIAADIENDGTISAHQGQIGLYAGQEVLVSTSPTGQGLAAKVTLPQGSVDNAGNLIADGGTIAALAQTVNNNGLIQANSIQDNNGAIELVAGDLVQLGASSVISAQGDSTGASSGGSVTIQSGNTFADQAGSTISVAGGAQGGNGGALEVSAANLGSIQSQVDGHAAPGFQGGAMTIDTSAITLNAAAESTYNGLITSGGLASFTVSADEIVVNSSWTTPRGLTELNFVAGDNINITANTLLNLADAGVPSTLNLSAGNSIIVNDGSLNKNGTVNECGIVAGKNWNVNLTAGTSFLPSGGQPPSPGNPAGGDYEYGVYLGDGQGPGGYIQTQNGNINIWAANEVIIPTVDLSISSLILSGAVRTMAGGNINVTAQYGDVNAGNNISGYDFSAKPNRNYEELYYAVDAQLGGISTGAGGNVTITAGGDVTSYLPTQNDYDSNLNPSKHDAGIGAFGPEAGNVTITAGGSVYGNYVVANGTGVINAGGNAGKTVDLSDLNADFALSLVKGSWTVNAQNIYLDDVINPNGVFNDSTTVYAGTHTFDYDAAASVALNAANAVEITGAEVPLIPKSQSALGPGEVSLPVLLPPSLSIVTGAGGLTLDCNVSLFPSADGNLSITTLNGGNFESRQNPNDTVDVNSYYLEMSASDSQQWADPGTSFTPSDRSTTAAVEVNNPNPVALNISGNMSEVNVYVTKEANVTIDGNLFNSAFLGQNLHASDATTINVAGSISFSPIYAFTTLSQSLGAGWDSFFSLLVDANPNDVNSVAKPIPAQDNPLLALNTAKDPTAVKDATTALKNLLAADLLFPVNDPNPGFVYDPATGLLGYQYQMNSFVRGILEGPLTAIVYQPNQPGVPDIYKAADGNYYFVTTPVSFVSASVIETLYQQSLTSVHDPTDLPLGFQIGGPGQFTINASSMDLGASQGIVSWGSSFGQSSGGLDYSALANLTDNAGAAINVNVTGDLRMLTSTIATFNGGNVTISSGGAINLGLAGVPFQPSNAGNIAYGIYTAGAGDVNVTANGDINIDTARIATFNGGNIIVESYNGDINAGNGANLDLQVPFYLYDPRTGTASSGLIADPPLYGSGILALVPSLDHQVSPGELPGNITVETPNGNIVSTLGGIAQFALDANVGGGPSVNLIAGTAGVAATSSQGNINLGQGGVVGGTVNVAAQGDIAGLIVSRQNTTVSGRNLNVTVLAGGSADVSAVGTLEGTLIANGALNVSGGDITAALYSTSTSANGGADQNSLGNATTSATAASAASTAVNDAKTEVASNNPGDDDKKKKAPVLLQRVKRVTVILPPKA